MSEAEIERRKFVEKEHGYGPCIRVYADKDEQFCMNMRAERNEGALRHLDPTNPLIFLRGGEGFTIMTSHHKGPDGKRYKVSPHFVQLTNKKINVVGDDDDELDEDDARGEVIIFALKLIRSGKLHVVIACTFWNHPSSASDELISLLPDKWQSRRIIDVIVINANPVVVTQNYALPVCQLTGKEYTVDFAILDTSANPTIFIDVDRTRGDGFHAACEALNVKYARLTTNDVRRCYLDQKDNCRTKMMDFTDEPPRAFPAADRLVVFSNSNHNDVFLCDQCKPAWGTTVTTCGDVAEAIIANNKKKIQKIQQEYEDENITTIAAVNSVMTSLAAAEAAARVSKASDAAAKAALESAEEAKAAIENENITTIAVVNSVMTSLAAAEAAARVSKASAAAATAALESAKDAKAVIENKYLKGQLTWLSFKSKWRYKTWSSFLLTETARKGGYTGVKISSSKDVKLKERLRTIAEAEDNAKEDPGILRKTPEFCYVKIRNLEAKSDFGCENQITLSQVDDVIVGEYLPKRPVGKVQ